MRRRGRFLRLRRLLRRSILFPAELNLFLYETLDNGVDKKAEKTAYSVIESGGVIAWVIVALGCLALLMIVMRAIMLALNMANVDRLVASLEPLLEQGQIDKAIDLCRRKKSAAGRVLRTTLRNLKASRHIFVPRLRSWSMKCRWRVTGRLNEARTASP